MNRLYILLFLLGSLNLNGQIINGVWQKYTSIVGSTYKETYEFNEDNTFKFSPSGFDGLTRILSFGGTFFIEKDTIYFTIRYIEECDGGNIIRSSITTLNNSWEIMDCICKKKEIIENNIWPVPYKLSNNNNQKTLSIGTDIYYLIKE